MATWYLLNTIRFGTSGVGASILTAGRLIDDTKTSLAAIQNAGGMVAPSTYPSVASQAAIVNGLLKRGGNVGVDQREADNLMMAAFGVDQLGMEQNRGTSDNAAGNTVAAAAAIAPAVTVTPKYSGKLRIRGTCSVQNFAAGTFRPIVTRTPTGGGAVTVYSHATYTGSATSFPRDVVFEVEITGLPLGTAQTFAFVSTAGDAQVTLGGTGGNSAHLVVEEVA